MTGRRSPFGPMSLDLATGQQQVCALWPHDPGVSGVGHRLRAAPGHRLHPAGVPASRSAGAACTGTIKPTPFPPAP